MQCEYSVTFKDFKESMKGFRKLSKGAAFAYLVDVWILPAVGVAMFLCWLIPYLRGDRETADTFFWFAFLGPSMFVLLPLFYELKLRQAFRVRTSLAEGSKVVLEFDDKTVRFSIPEKTNVSYPWTSFTGFFENETVGTLYVHKAAFHTIPKRAMDAADWDVFRNHINQQLGSK